jgi:hypothetical protein
MSVDFVHPSIGMGVLFTVDLDMEIRAKSGWVKHFLPLLSFSCHLGCSFFSGFWPRDTVLLFVLGT